DAGCRARAHRRLFPPDRAGSADAPGARAGLAVDLPRGRYGEALDSSAVELDRETEERIEQPVSAEAERETRLTPAEAVAQMRINVPVRGNRKLRRILERVNADTQLKAWWHV